MDQQKLPNATTVLVLGIIAIVTSCCYGVPGIVTSLISLALYKKDNARYKKNPGLYSNYSNLKTGMILNVIGLVLGVIFLVYYFYILNNVIGWDAISDPELLKQRIQDLQNQ